MAADYSSLPANLVHASTLDLASGYGKLGDAYIRGSQLALLKDQASERAGLLLQKQVGMRNAQLQADQLIKTGVDPMTARKTALLNNAQDLFADHPEFYAKVLDSDEAGAIKEKAQQQMDAYRNASLTELSRQHDLLSQAKANRESDRMIIEAQKRQIDAARLTVQAQHQSVTEDLKREGLGLAREGLDIKRGNADSLADYRSNKIDQNAVALDLRGQEAASRDDARQGNLAVKQTDVESKVKTREATTETAAGREARLQRNLISKDTVLRDLEDSLTTAKQNLDDRTQASPFTAPFRASPEHLKGIITDLEARKAARLKELGANPGAAPAAAPAGPAPGKVQYRWDSRLEKLVPVE